jgi:hypothetical protein
MEVTSYVHAFASEYVPARLRPTLRKISTTPCRSGYDDTSISSLSQAWNWSLRRTRLTLDLDVPPATSTSRLLRLNRRWTSFSTYAAACPNVDLRRFNGLPLPPASTPAACLYGLPLRPAPTACLHHSSSSSSSSSSISCSSGTSIFLFYM